MDRLLENISPELKLLLIAANPNHYSSHIQWLDLDWHRVEELVDWHQTQALLYREIRSRPEIPAKFMQSMQSDATATAVGNMILAKESDRLMKLLHDNGVDAFLMKGALWATLYYEEIGLREFGDIDFFINRPDVDKSVVVMDKAGYIADKYRAYLLSDPIRSNLYFTTDYQLPLEAKITQLIKSVELQWQVSYPRLAFSLDWSDLMACPEEHLIAGKTIRVPRAENQFLMMIVHHVGIEELDKLKYGMDLVMLLRKVGDALDWDYIFSKSREKGFFRLVTMGLQVARMLDKRITFPVSVHSKIENVENSEFIMSALKHWEDTRHKPLTKSWRIVLHQLKYRDRWTDRWHILKAHGRYITQFNLLYHKARWYLR
ncbi:nucleotidyltransferase domain-containing protein [Persicitalea jodogahamensis]|uniref:Nucleotidyltransferase family protein n=1 Tax=Persicitalea jodogahamensis TaxID=402147 RepID=A0A8J3D448_9BACT|nr:nucleotidyltransferase family protein [Persicitalea jodogahamensis]GHB56398.1 hypothetical protein GCM10007390_07170 [Persicitalea jodogahamensis]